MLLLLSLSAELAAAARCSCRGRLPVPPGLLLLTLLSQEVCGNVCV